MRHPHLPPAAAHFRAYVRLRSVNPARGHDRSYMAIFAQRIEKVKVPRGYGPGSSPSSSCNDWRQISGSA